MRSVDSVASKICGIIENEIGGGVSVNPTTNILRDLNLDSLAIMDVVLELEDHFNVSIPLNRLSHVETVSDLASAVASIKRNGG